MPVGVMMILQFLTLREKCEKVKIERLYLISFKKKGLLAVKRVFNKNKNCDIRVML